MFTCRNTKTATLPHEGAERLNFTQKKLQFAASQAYSEFYSSSSGTHVEILVHLQSSLQYRPNLSQ